MTTTLALSLLSISALLLSIAALFAALRSSGRFLFKRYDALCSRISDLEVRQDATETRIKSVRAQANAAYSRKANSELPEVTSETTEEAKDRWTRETNLRIARGELRPPIFRR